MRTNGDREQELFREICHAIPLTLIEEGLQRREQGGGVFTTDFAVPFQRVPDLYKKVNEICERDETAFVTCYGSVGTGNPRFAFLANDHQEKDSVEKTIYSLYKLAIQLGGTIAARDGIGKINSPYFKLQYPKFVRNSMYAIKKEIDPHGVLAPGNIWGPSIDRFNCTVNCSKF